MSETVAMSETVLRICGVDLVPLPQAALWWPDEATLIVSDLHLEKGSAFASRGVLLPPYDTRATLARLDALMQRLRPARVIALGDTFHDRTSRMRMDEADAARLGALAASCDWVWIVGNHDPEPPRGVAGQVGDEWRAGPLVFRHEPQSAPATGEISGHLHPCAAVRVRGRRMRRRCIASDGTRAIMPAFGAFTGGLNVLDEAYGTLLPGLDFHAWMMGADSVVPVAGRRLEAD